MKPVIQTIQGGPSPILIAHGFLGDPSEWEFLIDSLITQYTIHLLTLPGHIDAPIDENREEFFQDLDHFIQKNSPMTLLGYSMGSRILMEVASRNLSSIKQIIVESGNPGIVDQVEREQRYLSDSTAFKNIDYQLFLERWYRGPLFCHLNESLRNELILTKFTLHQANHLQKAMQLFSPGIQANLWPEMNKLQGHFISGELDLKYSQIGLQLSSMGWGLDVVPDVGHNVHLESADLYRNIILNLLS